MIISRRHRFVLLAPWKTASSTSHLRLAPYNESPYSRFYDYNPHLQRVTHQHITYADFTLLPESREGSLTGAFVRNPYDRVYSGFLELQRSIRTQPSAAFPSAWIKALVVRHLADVKAQLAAADFDFNRWFGLVEEFQIYEVGANLSFPLHPAHYWTGIDRRQKVHFVGKTENFEPDFDRFCRMAGIEPPEERANWNVSPQVANASPAGSPRYLHLMEDATIDKINTLFEADFELFGYDMRATTNPFRRADPHFGVPPIAASEAATAAKANRDA